jgi:hypothetical protein
MTFLDAAFKKRAEAHIALTKFIEELKQNGFEVYVPVKAIVLDIILIRKNEKHCFLEFHTGMYKWAISVSIDWREKKGSGKTLFTRYGHEFSIKIKDIEENMFDDYQNFNKDHKNYEIHQN